MRDKLLLKFHAFNVSNTASIFIKSNNKTFWVRKKFILYTLITVPSLIILIDIYFLNSNHFDLDLGIIIK